MKSENRILELYEDWSRIDDLIDFTKWRKTADNAAEGPSPEENQKVAGLNEMEKEKNRLASEITEALENENIDLDDRRERAILEQKFGSVPDRAREIENDIQRAVYGDGGAEELREKASEQEDFSVVEDEFSALVDLSRDYADAVIQESQKYDEGSERYEVFFDEYEPDMDLEEADEFLMELKEDLIELREEAEESKEDVNAGFEGIRNASDYSKFFELCSRIREELEIPEDDMPLDTSVHGMEHGNQYTAPILIDEDKPWLKALLSFLHEAGHGAHVLGLPKDDDFRTPRADAGSYTMRESQARFFENHIGRRRNFWEDIEDDVNELVDEDLQADEMYKRTAGFDPDNPIRVNSEEMSYHLHIIARYEIERDLINGDIEPEEVQDEWDKRMEDYLGLDPGELEESEKVLQDVHWFRGKFGYFPTYTLGTATAAQIYHSSEKLQDEIESGNYREAIDILEEEFHSRGYEKPGDELLEDITGESLNAERFTDYIEGRIGEL